MVNHYKYVTKSDAIRQEDYARRLQKKKAMLENMSSHLKMCVVTALIIIITKIM